MTIKELIDHLKTFPNPDDIVSVWLITSERHYCSLEITKAIHMQVDHPGRTVQFIVEVG